ncbi:MAG: DUF2764 family protein [Proteobacteria bacterium]|nr:DUF2764 family protein [Pseudomonadota bacterium]
MKYFRLLSMLPALPAVPDAPPLPLDELIDLIFEDLAESARPLALALLGFLDCKNVEALLQGYEVFDERAPISKEQLETREDLPEWLSEFLEAYDSGAITDAYAFDALWRAYFTALVEVAETSGSVFLQEWVSNELTLRDALVRYRAEIIGEKADMRMSGVAVQEGDSHSTLLSTLGEAANPMERERLLDAARLRKIEAISGIDPFSTDAALAYLAGAIILDRWNVGKTADTKKMLEVFA